MNFLLKKYNFLERELMRFRPCIDLHQGIVKQIIGSTLSDNNENNLKTNFQADKSPEWFASLYKRDNLTGGHVIKIGPGNKQAALNVLKAWPNGMQIGGGINNDNAKFWLNQGANSVIITSWVFHDGVVDTDRLKKLLKSIGKNRLVLDLSCRKKGNEYVIVTNRWQTYTNEIITYKLLDYLAAFCFEFLIHAVDVEGKCNGIETSLVKILGDWSKIPVTYAGGIQSNSDINIIENLGNSCIDFTVGSALDIFGGHYLKYNDLAEKYS